MVMTGFMIFKKVLSSLEQIQVTVIFILLSKNLKCHGKFAIHSKFIVTYWHIDERHFTVTVYMLALYLKVFF